MRRVDGGADVRARRRRTQTGRGGVLCEMVREGDHLYSTEHIHVMTAKGRIEIRSVTFEMPL